MTSPKHILVLGGNGFIGCEVVMRIIADHPKTRITLLNRGRSWDWDKFEMIGNQVKNIKHNRRRPLSECVELGRLLEDEDAGPLDGVVDLSGFSANMVKDSVKFFACRVPVYVYISSDSVYEVCAEKTHSGPSRETDAERPGNAVARHRAALGDDYGDDKLQCEELIQNCTFRNADNEVGNPCAFLVLRLADVVGPRDCTNRWWQYQVWVKLASMTNSKIPLPKEYMHRPLSFVYVKDVADVIVRILLDMSMSDLALNSMADRAFNIACKESPTLDQLVCDIQQTLTQLSTSVANVIMLAEYSDSDDTPQIYPSVERGSVDITKAVSLLGWDPTPWTEVVRDTVRFYERVITATASQPIVFRTERTDLYWTLRKDIRPFFSKDQLQLLKAILLLDQ